MSAQATFWAQRQRPTGGIVAKAILLCLADIHNDHDGTCRPKVFTVAERCMLSERHTRRMLASLEVDGLITRQERREKRGGFKIANNYVLHVAAVAKSGKPRPDTAVRSYKPRPDTAVRSMDRTQPSGLEPDHIEPDLKAGICGKPDTGSAGSADMAAADAAPDRPAIGSAMKDLVASLRAQSACRAPNKPIDRRFSNPVKGKDHAEIDFKKRRTGKGDNWRRAKLDLSGISVRRR